MSNELLNNTRRLAIAFTLSRGATSGWCAVTGLVTMASLVVMWASSASADTLTWKTTTGTWDLSALNWDPGPVAWTQTGTTSPLHDAIFGGTDGTYTVTLAGSQIAASNLTFNNSGYTLSGTSLFLGSGTVTVASGKAATIGSVIRGTSGLAKEGAGTLALSAANTFSGGVKVTAGTLLVGNKDAFGANLVDINGGNVGSSAATALNITSGSFRFSNDFTAAIDAGGQVTLSAPMTLANGTRTITVSSGQGFNLYGGISDDGNGYGLVKTGGSLMRLGGVNTYTGDTRVNQGTVTIWNNLAVQYSTLDTDGAGGFNITGANGSTTPTIGGFKGSKNQAIGNTVVSVSLNPAAGVSNTYSGVLSGSTSIIKINAGTQVFAGANTYTGTTDIRAGTLQIGNAGTAGALSPSSAITGSTGGTLTFNRSNQVTQGTDFNSVISGGLGVTQLGTGALILNGLNTYSGGTRINAGTVRAGGTSAFGSGGIILSSGATLDLNNLTIANAITNNGGAIVNALGFTGTTAVTSGTATLANIGGTVDIDASAVADLSGTIDAAVVVKAGGRGRAAGQIRNSVTVNAGAQFDILDGASINESASFINNGQMLVDRANDLTLSETITGSGGLRKSNTGKLTLTGSHDYSGNTLVDQGAFAVNGSLSGLGTVTINSGAILMGSGTINGPTIVEGIHSPGNSPGLETFTNGLTYGPSSVLVWELSANTDSLADRGTLYDGIDLTGGALNVTSGATLNLVFNAALASGSASVVNWSDAFWAMSRTWKILDVGSSATWNEGTFSLGSVGLDASGASLASVRGDASFNVSHDQDGSVYVNYVIVPEPGTVSVAGIGMAMLWAASAARRRRRV